MPPSLKEQFSDPALRRVVVKDAVDVLEAEVKDKPGLGGMAIKAAFGVLKSVSPGVLQQLVDKLLAEFAEAIDPLYQKAVLAGQAPGAAVLADPSATAQALLAVTDRRAARAGGDVIKKTYQKLRPSAEKHVEAAAPRLAGLLNKHALPG